MYGEVPLASLHEVLSYNTIETTGKVFYDLGSGCGRAILYARCAFPKRKAGSRVFPLTCIRNPDSSSESLWFSFPKPRCFNNYSVSAKVCSVIQILIFCDCHSVGVFLLMIPKWFLRISQQLSVGRSHVLKLAMLQLFRFKLRVIWA